MNHNTKSTRVVRMAGARHFGFDVTCSCGFKCTKHYTPRGATRCGTQHERDREFNPKVMRAVA